MKKTAILGLVCLVLLSGCGKKDLPGEETATTLSSQEMLTVVVTEDTIGELEGYPNLQKLDLTGSTCYKAILEYMEAHPETEVL